jgi:hypothetical protein
MLDAADSPKGVPLDALAGRLLASSPFAFRLAVSEDERRAAYRLRGETVVARHWAPADTLSDGAERDDFDDRAQHILGWDGGEPVCTGRIVLPPGLPTEQACGRIVEPAGRVADVGRMCVATSRQSLEHAAFIGLMAALYLEVRRLGFSVACGMMSAPAQRLVALFGLQLEMLGPPVSHWNELRTPVRFSLLHNADAAGHLADMPRESGGAEHE